MTSEAINIHAGREVCYSILSRIFLEIPSEKLYHELESLLPLMQSMESDECDIEKDIKVLDDFLKLRHTKKKAELKEFDLDTHRAYTRLFCLTDSVPTSESVYVSTDKIAMQEPRDNAMFFYNQCGFSMQSSSNEPEDHISYEFMFMSYLAKNTKNAISQGDRDKLHKLLMAQRDFLSIHLLKWCKLFCAKVEEYSDTINSNLYIAFASFMVKFVLSDSSYLENNE